MKAIFLSYRDWSNRVVSAIKHEEIISESLCFSSPEEFNSFISSTKDEWVIIAIGWSHILKPEITSKFFCIGAHPSDLPLYRGGSPIQHQIIDGVIDSKLSIFQLTERIDEGNILIKVDLSLKGDSISAIFDNLFLSTTKALKIFLKTYPNIQPLVQEKTNIKTLKRRNFEDSEITKDEFSEMSLLEIYNKIRCLTDPYPNAFLEDEHGNRLFFEGISYERNEKNQ